MRRLGWVVAVMAAGMLGGCGEDDDPPVKPPPPAIPDRTTPQNTLEYMRLSYEARDSVQTKQVYDTSYVGTSTDLSDPPGTQLATFRYADEIGHVAVLARTSTIFSIALDLGPQSAWTRLQSDDPSHPEWAMIQISSFHLDLYDGPTLYTALSTNPMTFTFTPNVAAPGDTTWKIVRWTEVATGGP